MGHIEDARAATEGMAASVVVAAIEDLWSAIQRRHPDVPDVVVTLGAGTIGTPRGAVRLGHFAASRWVDARGGATHELFVAGEGLAQGAVEVAGTLLHEAAHAVAHSRGIKDTSRQGRYHNRRFRALTEGLGLSIHEVPGIGWSGTDIPTATAAEYVTEVATLARAIRAYRRGEGGQVLTPPAGPGAQGGGATADEDAARAPKNGYSLSCECETPRKVRVSRAVALAGPIICGLCGQPFTHPDL